MVPVLSKVPAWPSERQDEDGGSSSNAYQTMPLSSRWEDMSGRGQ